MIRKHYIIYHTPGDGFKRAMFPTDLELDWQTSKLEAIDEAVERSADMNAENPAFRPFAFNFLTKARGENDLDSHVEAQSHLFWLGGHVESVSDLIARNDPTERIIVNNMRDLNADYVITNRNSFTWVQPFSPGDVVLPIPDWARSRMN